MNLDELRTVQRTERQRDSLQNLRESFYSDVAAYIEGLKDERERAAERASDPFSSPEVGRLTDEIGTAEEVVEAIYERRVGKVVKQATFAAADMPTDEEGLTAEEHRLFVDLVERIRENRQAVLDMLAGETPPGSAAESEGHVAEANPADPTPADATPSTDEHPPDVVDSPTPPPEEERTDPTPPPDTPDESVPPADDVLADAMGGGSDDADAGSSTESPTDQGEDAEPRDDPPIPPDVDARTDGASPAETEHGPTSPATDSVTSAADPGSSREETERVTVRITADVGRIVGVDDREYDLASEDVIELPTANAEPLVKKRAAERLE